MNRAARLLCETCSSTVAALRFCMPPSGPATYALSAAMSAPLIMAARQLKNLSLQHTNLHSTVRSRLQFERANGKARRASKPGY